MKVCGQSAEYKQHIRRKPLKHVWPAILALSALAASAQAAVIESIEVSTAAGYPETYTPSSFNRFGLLGVPYRYRLSDGRVAERGAGWTPYTNGSVASESLTADGRVVYQFEDLNNWAKGAGVLFYHLGGVCDVVPLSDCLLWTEGELIPVSPVVLEAVQGSQVASLSGLARVSFNNSSNNWGGGRTAFVPYSSPEASIVRYSATYTLLDGAGWAPGIFGSTFRYQLTGNISFVPVPNSLMLVALGLTLCLALTRRKNS